MNFIQVGMFVASFVFLGETFTRSANAKDFTIKFAVQNSEPKYLIKDNLVSGLCGDIYSHIQNGLKLLNVNTIISNQATPIKRVLLDLKLGHQHLFCGAGRNKGREKLYTYSVKPLYGVSNVIVVHRDDPMKPMSFQDLIDHKIEVATFFGTVSSEYLKAQIDTLANDSFIGLEHPLRLIADKKRFRAFFYHDLGLKYFIRHNELPLRVAPTKFRTYNHWMLYSKDLPRKYVDAVEKILSDLRRKEILEKITRTYLIASE